MSPASPERPRLLPVWAALAFGAAVALGLALLYPYEGLERALARRGGAPDALQIAYLEAWLAARPGDVGLRLWLARELMRADAPLRARAHLERVLAEAPPSLLREARKLAFDLDWREWTDAQGSAAPGALRARLRAQVRALLADERDPAAALALLPRAVALGEEGFAAQWLQALAAGERRLPPAVWEAAAMQALAQSRHLLAAHLLLRARDAERSLAQRRRLFLAALRAAQAGNALPEALALAERHLGELIADPETLEFLTRLALAANRPDVAAHYARLLLRIALAPPDLAARLRLLPRAVPATQAGEGQRTARLPFDERLYTLAFEVFLANRNLEDALLVARSAVRQRPENLHWRRKLAQVAEWANQPALAAEQWEEIARRTGRARDWQEVERRAAELGDRPQRLRALQALAQAAPADRELQWRLLRALEENGQPERAMQLLRASLAETGTDAWRAERLQWLARLAQDLGQTALAAQALETLVREFPEPVAHAVALAQLALRGGDEPRAAQALRAVQAAARDMAAHRDYWLLWAELAWARGETAEAAAVLERLYAAGVRDDDLLQALADVWEDTAPARAAELAEQRWRRSGAARDAVRALALWLRAGDQAAVGRFLQGLTPAQEQMLAGDADFLSLRAQWLYRRGEYRRAAHDAAQAWRLAPTAEREAALIWTQIAAEDAGALRARLLAAGERALAQPPLAAAAAAGWLHLQQPARALPYIARVARAGTNPLWALEYAAALEALGAAELAQSVRLAVWRERAGLRGGGDEEERTRRELRLLPLAAQYATGDEAAAYLRALAARRRAALDAESAPSYWLARGNVEAAQAWLEARQARGADAPAWAEAAIAFATGDRVRMRALLERSDAYALPPLAAANAAAASGASPLAQSVAFEALEAMPQHDDVHTRLRELLLGSTAQTAPSALVASADLLRQRPLSLFGWSAAGTLRLSPRLLAGAARERWQGTSRDAAALAFVPSATLYRLEVAGPGALDGEWRIALHAREALDSSAGASLQLTARPLPRITAAAALGSALPTVENAYLRLGGQSDRLNADVTLRLAQREQLVAGVQFDRFSSQRGEAIGRGRRLRFGAQHLLRTEYPDLALRAWAEWIRYAPAAGVAAGMLPLLPVAAQPGATNATWLPASSQRLTLEAAAGESVRESWSRGWRPYGVAFATRDSVAGTDLGLRVGAVGALLGADALSFEVGVGSGNATQGGSYLSGRVQYRWTF